MHSSNYSPSSGFLSLHPIFCTYFSCIYPVHLPASLLLPVFGKDSPKSPRFLFLCTNSDDPSWNFVEFLVNRRKTHWTKKSPKDIDFCSCFKQVPMPPGPNPESAVNKATHKSRLFVSQRGIAAAIYQCPSRRDR